MKGFNMEHILGICEKIMYFFCVNLLFLICNIPVLLFFLFVGISEVRTYLPLFMLSMVPFGAAFSAVLYCMNRIIAGTEVNAFRDFKKGYLSDWGQKMLLGFCQMLAILIFYTSMEFFAVQIPFLPFVILMGAFLAVSILVTPYLYLLAARYKMGTVQTIKDAVILLITRPGITLGNVAAFGIILMFIEIQAGTTVLFMGSVYGFLVAFMSRGILRFLEESQ